MATSDPVTVDKASHILDYPNFRRASRSPVNATGLAPQVPAKLLQAVTSVLDARL